MVYTQTQILQACTHPATMKAPPAALPPNLQVQRPFQSACAPDPDALQHEVFLVDAIERERTEKMPHLKAVYFLRPTAENVRLLQKEFKEPKYGEYHVFLKPDA